MDGLIDRFEEKPFVQWADHIQRTTSFTAVEIMDSAAELSEYGYPLVGAKRNNPGDDFTSDLIRIEDESGGLSNDEIVQNLLLILVARTTRRSRRWPCVSGLC